MLRFIVNIIKFFGNYLRQLGSCANVGLIIGAIVGGIISLLHFIHGGVFTPTTEEIVWLTLILTFFSWCVVLFILVIFVRSKLFTVIFPTLFISLLVTVLTVYLCMASGLHSVCWLIGMIVGILVGYLFCGLFKRIMG